MRVTHDSLKRFGSEFILLAIFTFYVDSIRQRIMKIENNCSWDGLNTKRGVEVEMMAERLDNREDSGISSSRGRGGRRNQLLK